VPLLRLSQPDPREEDRRDRQARISRSVSVPFPEVLPQIREFERVSTTLVNAYTAPKLKRYLGHLQSELVRLGFESEFLVMLSSGGTMNADYAGKYAVYSLLSGPAGGVVACAQLIGDLCRSRTSSPSTWRDELRRFLIRGGKPSVSTGCWFNDTGWLSQCWMFTRSARWREHSVGGPGRRTPGGSPECGRVSGPACYGRGGREPTVTDANLLLGFLDPENFLAGR